MIHYSKNSLWLFSCMLLSLHISLIPQSHAQSWGPTATTGNQIMLFTSNNTLPTQRVNCDLYDYGTDPASGNEHFVMASVYDQIPGGGGPSHINLDVFAYYYASPDIVGGGTLEVPSLGDPLHPDVVIGDDPATFGSSFPDLTIGVVYEESGEIYYCQYNVTNITNSPLGLLTGTTFPSLGIYVSVTLTYGPVQISNGYGTAHEPHIDMMPDPTSFNTGIFGIGTFVRQLDKYVITWTEDPGTGNEIRATVGNFSVTPTSMPSFQTIDNGEMSDVACVYDGSGMTATETAYFTYYDPSVPELKVADWEINGTTVNTGTLESGTVYGCPRIEAMNQSTGASNTNLWHAIASIDNGSSCTGSSEIHSYFYDNSTLHTNNYMSMTTALCGIDHYAPAVGAGVGTPSGNSDIGNTTYTVGWYMTKNNNFNALSLDLSYSSGNPTGYLDGYDIVNNGTLSGLLTSPSEPSLALGNASNSGWGLISAWHDGSNMNTKLSGNTFFFKQANNVYRIDNGKYYNLYPNPATDNLFIQGAKEGSYRITNLVGQNVMSGNITGQNTKVDVSALSSAMYIINITENGKTQKVKFVKQ